MITGVNNTIKRVQNTADDWSLSLTVQNKTHFDAQNILGIHSGLNEVYVFEPPCLEEFCSGYFGSERGKLTCELKKPFLSFNEIKEWQFRIESSGIGQDHDVSWNRWNTEGGVYIYLVDQQAEQVIDMSSQDFYRFKMNARNRSFTIYATQDPDFIPKIIPITFRLLQNYPNPFNPRTTIKFGIPAGLNDQLVTLKIYNILGQEINTLLNVKMPAGYHEVLWNSCDTQNRQVASGVYFYSISCGTFKETRKMVLLR